MAIAGKVAITPKGEWNAQTAYTKLDLVFYENASYVAIQPSTGVEPTNESYWMLMVQSAGGADLDGIIDGSIQVGNAKTLDGHEAEYFAPKADLAKYLPLTGGTVITNGHTPLKIKNTGGNLAFTRWDGVDYDLGSLGFSAKDIPAYRNSAVTAIYPLLHTGNKPTGTYTGNGDATQRIINTGGTGKACLVWSDNGTALISFTGSLLYASSGVNALGGDGATFRNNNILLYTTDNKLNANGVTYNYQVL